MAESVTMTLYGFELPNLAARLYYTYNDMLSEVESEPSAEPSAEASAETVETVLVGQTLQDTIPVNEIWSYVWRPPTPTRLQEECACQMMTFLVFMFALWCCCRPRRRPPVLVMDSANQITSAKEIKEIKEVKEVKEVKEEPDHIHV